MTNNNSQKPTIKDISARTGLALGTISKYLNGGKLRKENAYKIKKAIEDLDYNVDYYARAMITKKTFSVGIVLPELGNQFYGLIASQIGKILYQNGYEIIIKESDFNPNMERNCVNWFVERRIDGIIDITCGGNEEFYKNLNYPNIVFVDNVLSDLEAETVVSNNREIVKEAINYLFDMGHRKIAAIFANNVYTSRERELGYRDAFKERGIEVDESIVFHMNDTTDEAYNIVEKTIDTGMYTALFASNYLSTLGAIFSINKKDTSILSKVSFIGFDNIMLTNLFKPELTIINQPIEKIASKAAERILAIIDNPNLKTQENIIQCELIKGQTVFKLNN